MHPYIIYFFKKIIVNFFVGSWGLNPGPCIKYITNFAKLTSTNYSWFDSKYKIKIKLNHLIKQKISSKKI